MFSEDTCGVDCWTAKQLICRCSCGGANHGRFRAEELEAGVPFEELPLRHSRIFGEIYDLKAIGYRKELAPDADKINEMFGWYNIVKYPDGTIYHYSWRTAKPKEHPPAILKYATESQIKGWPELEPFSREPKYIRSVSLLWVRQDMPTILYCEEECDRCMAHKMQYRYKLIQ